MKLFVQRGPQPGLVRRRFLWVTAGCLWVGAIATGMGLLAWHEHAPGLAARPPERWPPDSQIPLSDHGDTLVMFAHPRCPCTRASIGELEKIVSRYPRNLTTWVVFLKPSCTDEAWTETDQQATAAALPGVDVIRDVDGTEAQRFHAKTSGQALLYDREGTLQFSGGITGSRGHAGDNAGRRAIETLLSGAKPGRCTSPVFGCPLSESPQRE